MLEVSRNDTDLDLIIKVIEKSFNLLKFSQRYDNERKNKGFIELIDENFLGSGNQITLHGEYGVKDQKISLKSQKYPLRILQNRPGLYG